jgi:site-specific DNA recombinase
MAVRALTKTAPTALLYVRVSTKGQEDDGTSLDTQEQACRAHAESLGYAVAQVFREVYSGAELFDRPQLNALRAEARTHKHAAVIVYALDRLTRAQGLTAYLLSEFERAGCEIVSVTDPLDTSKEGKLIIGIKEYVAEVEREKIRERSLRGKRARVESGKLPNFGTELYGYRRDRERGVRVICEPEAQIIREIFHAIAVEGLSSRAVWRRLIARGTPCPRVSTGGKQDAPWGNSTVTRIIHQPAYKGDTTCWRWRRDPVTHHMTRRPASETVTLPRGTTPAIVSEEMWESANARLATNGSTRTCNAQRPYLLRGLIRCARCGGTMAANDAHGRRTYRCTSRTSVSGSCGAKSAPGEDVCRGNRPGVESWAWEQVSTILQDPTIITRELSRLQDQGPSEALTRELEQATARLQTLDKQQRRLMQRYADATDDDFPWELVQEQVTRLEQEKKTVSGIVAETGRRMAQAQTVVDQLCDLRAYIDRVASNLQRFDFEEKRLALEALGVTVYADGREWRLEVSIPLTENAGKALQTSRELQHPRSGCVAPGLRHRVIRNHLDLACLRPDDSVDLPTRRSVHD